MVFVFEGRSEFERIGAFFLMIISETKRTNICKKDEQTNQIIRRANCKIAEFATKMTISELGIQFS